ncbi:hypothetical protein UlMin_031234 [Ulmus minor]
MATGDHPNQDDDSRSFPHIYQPKSPNIHGDNTRSQDKLSHPISPSVLPIYKPLQIGHQLQKQAYP